MEIRRKKMKKKLSLTIVSLMCLGVFGLTACNPTVTSSEAASVADTTSEVSSEVDSVEDTSVVSNPVYKLIGIINKADLMASWKVEESDRELDLIVDPVANINLLVSTDMLTVTSSDTDVVTAAGIKLHAVAAGTATITVTLISGDTTITDTVDLTIEAAPAYISLEAARQVASGETVKTRGYVTSIVDDLKYATIADGEFAIELYGLSEELLGDIKVGDLVFVKGTSSPYNGLMEIGTIEDLTKLEPTDDENADVLKPVVLEITDWDAIPDNSDSRMVKIENMILTSVPSDYDLDDTAGTRFSFGVTLNGVEVATSVDYHNGDDACDEIYTKLSSVYPTASVAFEGLLTVYGNSYQIAPMDASELTVVNPAMTQALGLQILESDLAKLDYSEGTYEIADLPLVDLSDNYMVEYKVSSEISDLVTIDDATGKVTIVDPTEVTTGIIVGTILLKTDDSVMVGSPYIIDVQLSVPLVEPDAVAGKTIDDLFAVEEADYSMHKYTGVTGVISALAADDGSMYGNLYVGSNATTTKKFKVFGATATVGSIKFDTHSGLYYFSNPKDFLTNAETSGIMNGATITFNAIRYAYGDTDELSIEITNIVPAEVVEVAPIENGMRLTSGDFTASDTSYYGPATGTVGGISFNADYTSVGNAWFQMKDKNETDVSAISNSTALTKAIDTITVKLHTEHSEYELDAGAFLLSTSTAAIAGGIESDTADVQASEVIAIDGGNFRTFTFDVDDSAGDTFFKLSRDGKGTAYVAEIVINYVA